jgi:hypothetical protein
MALPRQIHVQKKPRVWPLAGGSRGHWRLTRRGLAVAKRLYPEIKARTKREVAADIAFRNTLHATLGPRRRRLRGKASTGKSPAGSPKRDAEVGEAGIEFELDF